MERRGRPDAEGGAGLVEWRGGDSAAVRASRRGRRGDGAQLERRGGHRAAVGRPAWWHTR